MGSGERSPKEEVSLNYGTALSPASSSTSSSCDRAIGGSGSDKVANRSRKAVSKTEKAALLTNNNMLKYLMKLQKGQAKMVPEGKVDCQQSSSPPL